MRKLLILSAPEEQFSDASVDILRRAAEGAFRVSFLPSGASTEARRAAVAQAEVVIGEPLLEELRDAPTLRWIQLTWAGADRYIRGASEFPAGVSLTCATGAFGVTISEHVLGMLLALCRNLPVYRAYQQQGVHHLYRPERLLYGGNAVILGTGDVGTEVARRLRAFGMKLTGVCRTPRPIPEFDRVCALRDADAALRQADVIVCCLPGTAETRGYFDRARLRTLKKDAVLLNVGRGSLIDSDALADVMQAGQLYGAGLDVTEPEPLPAAHPLRHMDNVILTPHVAGVSLGAAPETERRIVNICCENLRRYLHGEPLRNVVDFQTGYRARITW